MVIKKQLVKRGHNDLALLIIKGSEWNDQA